MPNEIKFKWVKGRLHIEYPNPDLVIENIGLLFDLQDAIRGEIQRVMGVGRELPDALECARFDIPISYRS